MSAKSVVSAVVGFLTHHITDLVNISDVLADIVTGLPIDSQDKDRILEAVNGVRQSAENIGDWLAGNSVKAGDVVVKESDIRNAIAGFLASDEGKTYIQSLLASTEGNGNA